MEVRVRGGVVGFLVLVVVGVGWWLWGGEEAPPELEHRKEVAEDEVVPELRGAEGVAAPRPDASTPRPSAHAATTAADAPDPTHYVIEGRIEMADPTLRVPDGEITADAAYTYVRLGRKHAEGKLWRATPDRAGRFTLRIEGAPPYPVTRFGFEGGAARVFDWRVEGAEAPRRLDTSAGAVNQVVLTLVATFRLQGTVVTSRGREPVAGATLAWGTLHPVGKARILTQARATAGADGRFDVGPFDADVSKIPESTRNRLALGVEAAGHPLVRVDPWAIAADERDAVRVIMDEGATIGGVLLDPDGRPLPGVVVALEYGADWQRRKAARTDDRGQWRLERVSRGPTRIQALAAARGCKVDQRYEVVEDDLHVELVTRRLPMPDPSSIRRAAGWGLAEITEEQRKAWMLPEGVKIVILEVPEDHARFGIGAVEPGNGLWMVGDSAVTSTREAVTRLLALSEPTGAAHSRTIPTARVVYTFRAEHMRGTNTQHMRLTSRDRAELQALAAELKKR